MVVVQGDFQVCPRSGHLAWGLLVEFNDLHGCLGIPLLLLVVNNGLLEELMSLLGYAGELTSGQVEADMHEVDWVIWDQDFRMLGGYKEV